MMTIIVFHNLFLSELQVSYFRCVLVCHDLFSRFWNVQLVTKFIFNKKVTFIPIKFNPSIDLDEIFGSVC